MGMGGRRWGRTGLALVVAGVLAAGAAGCSSGSGGGSSATTLSPRDEFVSQVTAVCQKMKAKADDLNKTAATLTDESKFGDLLDQNLAILQSAITDLQAVHPDAADTAAMKAYLADLDDLLTQTKTVVTALQAGDQPGAQAAQQKQQASQKTANDAATALGLDACVIT